MKTYYLVMSEVRKCCPIKAAIIGTAQVNGSLFKNEVLRRVGDADIYQDCLRCAPLCGIIRLTVTPCYTRNYAFFQAKNRKNVK